MTDIIKEAMTDKVEELLDAMKEDYSRWQNQSGLDDEYRLFMASG